MAGLNESFYANPTAKRTMTKHSKRLAMIESVRKENGLKPLSYEQKIATAVTLDNTQRHIKIHEALNYGGASQPSNIGQLN